MASSIGAVAGTALGSIAGNQISRATSGGSAAPGLRSIGTGRSFFKRMGSNNNSLRINVDPRINEGQESFLSNVRGLRNEVDPFFDRAQSELGEIRGELGGLKDFFAEDAGFTDSVLNPVREGIASRRGALTTELGRTDVRGSFKNAELNKFGRDSDRALSDATASAETQRIGNLSKLLGMDATLLSQGLQNDVGRTNLLMSLEESLRGVSTERFNQELSLLGIGQGIGVTPLQQAQQMNQQGIFSGLATEALGGILGSFDGGGTTMPPGGTTFNSAAGGI